MATNENSNDEQADMRFAILQAEIYEVRELVEGLQSSIQELITLQTNIRGTMHVLGWVERGSIWLAKVAAGMALLYASIKHFGKS